MYIYIYTHTNIGMCMYMYNIVVFWKKVFWLLTKFSKNLWESTVGSFSDLFLWKPIQSSYACHYYASNLFWIFFRNKIFQYFNSSIEVFSWKISSLFDFIEDKQLRNCSSNSSWFLSEAILLLGFSRLK